MDRRSFYNNYLHRTNEIISSMLRLLNRLLFYSPWSLHHNIKATFRLSIHEHLWRQNVNWYFEQGRESSRFRGKITSISANVTFVWRFNVLRTFPHSRIQIYTRIGRSMYIRLLFISEVTSARRPLCPIRSSYEWKPISRLPLRTLSPLLFTCPSNIQTDSDFRCSFFLPNLFLFPFFSPSFSLVEERKVSHTLLRGSVRIRVKKSIALKPSNAPVTEKEISSYHSHYRYLFSLLLSLLSSLSLFLNPSKQTRRKRFSLWSRINADSIHDDLFISNLSFFHSLSIKPIFESFIPSSFILLQFISFSFCFITFYRARKSFHSLWIRYIFYGIRKRKKCCHNLNLD